VQAGARDQVSPLFGLTYEEFAFFPDRHLSLTNVPPTRASWIQVDPFWRVTPRHLRLRKIDHRRGVIGFFKLFSPGFFFSVFFFGVRIERPSSALERRSTPAAGYRGRPPFPSNLDLLLRPRLEAPHPPLFCFAYLRHFFLFFRIRKRNLISGRRPYMMRLAELAL